MVKDAEMILRNIILAMESERALLAETFSADDRINAKLELLLHLVNY